MFALVIPLLRNEDGQPELQYETLSQNKKVEDSV
jgi:hypothetical protein